MSHRTSILVLGFFSAVFSTLVGCGADADRAGSPAEPPPGASSGGAPGTPPAAGGGDAGATADAGTQEDSGSEPAPNPSSPGTIFTVATNDPAVFDCKKKGVKPGDTIVLASGVHDLSRVFQNCSGSAGSYITIKNDTTAKAPTTIRTASGQPRYGIKFQDCEYVELTGLGGWSGHTSGCGVDDDLNAEGTDCGIYLDGATNGPAQDMVLLQGKRRFITIEGIEAEGDWSGKSDGNYTSAHGINTNDQKYCRDQHPGEWEEGITIRKTYLHNFVATSMYIGSNIDHVCNGSQDNELQLRSLVIEYNVWDTIGEGGAKIKSVPGSDPKQAIIRYNHGYDGGGSTATTAQGANSVGFACFEASCEVYGNLIDTTVNDGKTGPGLGCNMNHRPKSWGTQVCHYFDNVVRNTSGSGISASRRPSGCCGTTAPQELNVEYNTIVDAGQQAGSCINADSDTGSGYARNNICAGNTKISSANITTLPNTTGTVAGQYFVAPNLGDYHLTTKSPAKNAGTAPCPSTDADGAPRPKGGTCDTGAYELAE